MTRRFGATVVLRGLDLEVPRGEIVALLGRSGSGKSTALRILAGLDHDYDDGRVHIDGAPSVVFQSARLLPWRTVAENVRHGLNRVRASRPEKSGRVDRMLTEVGLAGREDAYPGELSGGQAQRVAIARALVGSPGVIFADEPTGALDQTTGAEVMAVLTQAAARSGAALVVVTHDPTVARWCSRTVAMRDGLVSGEFFAPGRQGDAPSPAEQGGQAR